MYLFGETWEKLKQPIKNDLWITWNWFGKGLTCHLLYQVVCDWEVSNIPQKKAFEVTSNLSFWSHFTSYGDRKLEYFETIAAIFNVINCFLKKRLRNTEKSRLSLENKKKVVNIQWGVHGYFLFTGEQNLQEIY